MVEAGRRSQQPSFYFPHPPAPAALPSRADSPNGLSLKRAAAWEKDEYPSMKRPRSEHSPEASSVAMFDRRASIDFPTRNVYSPNPSEAAPQSAYPRHGSPGLSGRPLRPLPSPSSLAYPPSAAASLPPPTVHPGSPAPSYQASSSIHTASTSSATSAHIADLQHQVTLKSLALQTLQSEYSGLLQKLQRERVKSQTIEKKTNVSEQEVNDLTGKNEELSEQVNSLQVQLDDSERRRDSERADATKEKEQWGRMLDMSGRLQAKLAVERQNLVEERDELQQRVRSLEDEIKGRRPGTVDATPTSGSTRQDAGGVRSSAPASQGHTTGDVASLKREVGLLTARLEILIFALQEARRHNEELRDQSLRSTERSDAIAKAIDRALQDTEPTPPKPITEPAQSTTSPNVALPSMTQPMPHAPTVVLSDSPPKLAPLAPPQHGGKPATMLTPVSATGPSLAEMVSAGRAVSPGPEERGIVVQPSTSSPEELIKALGPIPVPAPISRFEAPYMYGMPHSTRKSRSPPMAAPGYAAASPYRQVPSPYTGQVNAWPRQRASPPSNYSSPGSSSQGDSSPNSMSDSGRRSSVENNVLPPLDQGLSQRNPVRVFPDMGNAAAPGLASFRQWGHETRRHDATNAMPPPPRPFPSAQPLAFGQATGN
jgi:hypothetical protein